MTNVRNTEVPMNEDKDDERSVPECLCYGLAGMAVLVGIISMFVPLLFADKKIPVESLYWFFFALVAILFPYVKSISFNKLKIVVNDMKTFKKNINEAKSLLQEIREKADRPRLELIRGYQCYLETLSDEERMTKVKRLSGLYLKDMDLNIRDVKKLLKEHGCFQGEINDRSCQEYYEGLRAFQTKNGLIVDGIFGYQTYRKLLELDSNTPA
jgi:hypothetical protein